MQGSNTNSGYQTGRNEAMGKGPAPTSRRHAVARAKSVPEGMDLLPQKGDASKVAVTHRRETMMGLRAIKAPKVGQG